MYNFSVAYLYLKTSIVYLREIYIRNNITTPYTLNLLMKTNALIFFFNSKVLLYSKYTAYNNTK